MFKFVPLLSLIVLFSVVPARCDEESENGTGLWQKLKEAVKKFADSMRSLFSELKDEIKARTADMRSWTKEMMDSFKIKMKEWVNEAKASESEKEEMVDYIEKLQMPNDV